MPFMFYFSSEGRQIGKQGGGQNPTFRHCTDEKIWTLKKTREFCSAIKVKLELDTYNFNNEIILNSFSW